MKIDFTGTSMYLKCGRQYKFRYVDGIRSIPSVAMFEGTGHHRALEMNNRNKMEKGLDMKPNSLTEKFVHEFRREIHGVERVSWEQDNERMIIDRAKILHNDYINGLAKKINPTSVEEKFDLKLKLGDVELNLFGAKDVEDAKTVYDYKVTGKMKTQRDADDSLQLSLYAMASQKSKVAFICFVKKANPEVGIVRSIRNRKDLQWALEVVKSAHMGMEAGIFNLTDPQNWWCSERFCGYWKMCRGKYVG